jgi:hypothetical protein
MVSATPDWRGSGVKKCLNRRLSTSQRWRTFKRRFWARQAVAAAHIAAMYPVGRGRLPPTCTFDALGRQPSISSASELARLRLTCPTRPISYCYDWALVKAAMTSRCPSNLQRLLHAPSVQMNKHPSPVHPSHFSSNSGLKGPITLLGLRRLHSLGFVFITSGRSRKRKITSDRDIPGH